jgi:hypothetical protein
VPDATTLSDRLYRWLGKGGGHVNAFQQVDQLAELLTNWTGLPLQGVTDLHSGFSFMNRRSCSSPPRRLWLLGGGFQWSIELLTYLLRGLDRVSGTRTSVYGWAYFLGTCRPLTLIPRTNVCIRCGAGHAASALRESAVRSTWMGIKRYQCPICQTTNLFTSDRS